MRVCGLAIWSPGKENESAQESNMLYQSDASYCEIVACLQRKTDAKFLMSSAINWDVLDQS